MTSTSSGHARAAAGSGPPINELIALGALLALAAWGLIEWSGRGGIPVAWGPAEAFGRIAGRSLSLADLPLVIMLAALAVRRIRRSVNHDSSDRSA